MLSFTIHDLGAAAVFECKGRLTIEGAKRLRDAVMAHNHVAVAVLDLRDVSDVDAAGLGTLASLKAWAQATGTKLKLMNLTRRVERALTLTRLNTVFTICSARDLLELWCLALHKPYAAPLKQAVGI